MNNAVASPRIRFSTADLPEQHRFPAFCDGMFRNIIGADIEQTGDGAFAGALDIRVADPVIVADIAVTPASLSRHASHIRDGDDAIVLQLWQRGSAGLIQEDDAQRVEGRDALVIDNAKPTVLWPDTPARFWALTIPRTALHTAAAGAMHVRARRIADNAACRLLRSYLEETSAEEFSQAQSSRLVGDHFVDLAAMALAPHFQRAADSEGVRVARRMAILREIDRQRGNPGLSAIMIALQLGITPRYVHLLLEETGKSFTHHVLERRLERAATLLRDLRQRECKIADIAAEAGFTDLSYFNRSFRRHFGMTPSELRQYERDAGHTG